MGSEDTTAKLPKALADWEERLSALEQKFVDRKYDTRPIFEAHEERIKILEAQVAKLKKEPAQADLTFARNMYWAKEDQVPFCPNCFEGTKQERRHLQPYGDPGQYKCTNCKQYFKDRAILDRQSQTFPFGLVVGSDDEDY